MEGDDQQDPLVDAVRARSTGMWFFARLAAEGWYPPIAVLDSMSRLMPAVAGEEHREQAALVRKLMAVYARSETGAHWRVQTRRRSGVDRELRARDTIRAFLTQDAREQVRFADGCDGLPLWPTRCERWPCRGSWRGTRRRDMAVSAPCAGYCGAEMEEERAVRR